MRDQTHNQAMQQQQPGTAESTSKAPPACQLIATSKTPTPLSCRAFATQVASLSTAELDDCVDQDGRPLMLAAVLDGDLDKLQILIEAGANPDLIDPGQMAPLLAAALEGECSVMQLLMQAGADPNKSGDDGFSALHLAVGCGQLNAAKLLIDAGADVNKPGSVSLGETPLHVAALAGDAVAIEMLIDQSPDVDALTKSGLTALILAARIGHSDAVRTLIQAGAEVNRHCRNFPLRNDSGVCSRGELQRRILNDKQNTTALHAAASGGHCEVLQLLLKANADPTKADKYNRLPSKDASQQGYTAVTELLAFAACEAGAAREASRLIAEEEAVSAACAASLIADEEAREGREAAKKKRRKQKKKRAQQRRAAISRGANGQVSTEATERAPEEQSVGWQHEGICQGVDQIECVTHGQPECLRAGPTDWVADCGNVDAEHVPAYLVCPISFEQFIDPVVCTDGHTFERNAIEEWLVNHDTSPLTNIVLPSKVLVPNYALRQALRQAPNYALRQAL